MPILVTGGAGFIASHIVDALIERGLDVHVMDDLTGGYEHNINPSATFHKMDIRSDEAAECVRQNKFETIFHLAAQMDVRKSVADPRFDADVNILGFLNLMEAGKESGLKKVIFSSTGGAIYGEPDYIPQDENHVERPLSPYGIAKLNTERYLYYYEASCGIQYVALRYGNVYGPRQNPHGEAGVIAIFSQRMLREQPLKINGDGLQTRDYVFVEDVVRANLAAMDYEGSAVLNIGTGVETNVVELFRHIKNFTASEAEEIHAPAAPGEQRQSVISAKLAKETLGWTPEVTIQDGLKRTVDWFIQQEAS